MIFECKFGGQVILGGTCGPRTKCPRGHIVLEPDVWRTTDPRTGSPGGHILGGGGGGGGQVIL